MKPEGANKPTVEGRVYSEQVMERPNQAAYPMAWLDGSSWPKSIGKQGSNLRSSNPQAIATCINQCCKGSRRPPNIHRTVASRQRSIGDCGERRVSFKKKKTCAGVCCISLLQTSSILSFERRVGLLHWLVRPLKKKKTRQVPWGELFKTHFHQAKKAKTITK